MQERDVYRQCASILVFRPAEGGGYEFLLLHKPRKNDVWQLPQGGREGGETVEEAAVRELKEEAGITADVLGKSTLAYQYDFPASYRRFRPDNVCGQCVHFIVARLGEGQEVRVDRKEIDAHAWVRATDLSRYIKRAEYLDIVQRLVTEGMLLLP